MSMTMEQILEKIKQERGESALRDGKRLIGLFADYSKGQLKSQANALKVFLTCQGNTRILNLQNAKVQERQVQFHRLVREMVTEHNMQEETAVEVCSTFWRVALETTPPVYTLRQSFMSDPVPVPPPEPEECEEKQLDEEQPPIPVPPKPDPKPKSRRSRKAVFIVMALVAIAVLATVSYLKDSTDKRTRSDLTPFHLEKSVEDMLLAGTEAVYTYPDGTRMEFYYDDSGKEIYRL